MKTFEYRLFVNKAQARLLMGCLAESRKLYNEMLEEMKAQYEQDGTFPTKYDLTARFKGRRGRTEILVCAYPYLSFLWVYR